MATESPRNETRRPAPDHDHQHETGGERTEVLPLAAAVMAGLIAAAALLALFAR